MLSIAKKEQQQAEYLKFLQEPDPQTVIPSSVLWIPV